jgi:hypothetical protein
MAVTDFESYGPMGARPTPGPYAPSGFDQNMLAAYRQGRYNRMAGGRPPPKGGDYTLEELGSAPVPYRQGGMIYEPVGPQGATPRQIGGPQGAPRLGYERGPLEGEFTEVFGLGGPQAQPYRGSMDFGVTREGMSSPRADRMNFGPSAHTAGATAGAIGIDQIASMRDYLQRQASRDVPRFNPNIPVSGEQMGMSQMYPVMPMGATALSGQAPGAGAAFEAPTVPSGRTEGRRAAGKKAEGKGAPLPPKRPGDLTVEAPFEPNLNYLVTEALDKLLGGAEAQRGRQFQQYYERQGYY